MVGAWFVLLFTVCTGSLPPSPKVTIRTGKLRGTYMTTRDGKLIEAYLGVPYAIPPLGELRFEPAQPAKPWKGIKSAKTMPPACIQQKTTVGNKSEDCLYLNVFTPKSCPKAKLPVMVWIHGGVFELNAISTFTPEYMLDEPIVLVSIQYRLGLFGSLSTGDQVMPGNQALKDQRLGLRWIRDNIQKFGGDPAKVTLFGNSVGGSSIHALMLFSGKEDLFRAGICQSGVSLTTVGFALPNEVREMVQTLSLLSKCPTDSTGLVNCLKEKSADFIFNLLSQYKMSQPFGRPTEGMFPLLGLVLEPDCVPDRIVTSNPWDLSVDFPWITGVTDKEYLKQLAPLAADTSNTLFNYFETKYNELLPQALKYQYSSADGSEVPNATRSFYLRNRPISRDTFPQLVDVMSDAFFTYGMYEAALRSNRSRTYVYLFEYIGVNHDYIPIPRNEIVGAAHEDELPFFFPHPFNIINNRNYSKDDDLLSRKLVRLWVNFATYLNPTPFQDELEWKPFGVEEYFFILGQNSTSLNNTFLRDRMEFWQNQPYIIRDDVIESVNCKVTEN